MRASTFVTAACLVCCAAGGLHGAPTGDGSDAALARHLPAQAAPALRRLIGTYGAPEGLLIIYEDGGALYAEGPGFHRATLTPLGRGDFSVAYDGAGRATGRLSVEAGNDGPPQAVVLDGVRRPARDIGAEVANSIRTGMQSDAAGLRAAALAQAPPVEPGSKRKSDLVPLAAIDPTFKFDIRYATTDNFMGFALYEQPGAYLQRPAAEALRRVSDRLAPLGYGLLIFDGYRPWFVTRMFWDATPPGAHNFVADPAQGSRHNRGCAVDLTLYERKSGSAVEMTGRYDEMSVRSFAAFAGGTARQRGLRDLLRHAMEEEGFAVYPDEWWHFDFEAWHDYPIGNASFRDLGKGASAAH